MERVSELNIWSHIRGTEAHLDGLHAQCSDLDVRASAEPVLVRKEAHAVLERFRVGQEFRLAAHGGLKAAHVVLLECCNREPQRSAAHAHECRREHALADGDFAFASESGRPSLPISPPRESSDALSECCPARSRSRSASLRPTPSVLRSARSRLPIAMMVALSLRRFGSRSSTLNPSLSRCRLCHPECRIEDGGSDGLVVL